MQVRFPIASDAVAQSRAEWLYRHLRGEVLNLQYTSDARLVDYTLSEILQMQAFAALPKSSGLDTCQCFVLCQSEQAAYLRRMRNIGVIFESELFEAGADSESMMLPWMLLREVRDSKARTRREINAILDWTLARQRMDANPSYYGALSSTPHDVSSRLSQLTDGVFRSLKLLAASKW